MAADLSVSTKEYSYITFIPNSSDNWDSDSPFGTTLGIGDTAFALGTISLESFSTHKPIVGRLMKLGNINRKVNPLLSISKGEQGVRKINGIGGVAVIGDFSFTLENITGSTDALRLIGRGITVVVGTGTTMEDTGANIATVFAGRIYKLNPARKSISFTVRGNLQIWNKLLGTITTFSQEQNKNKIYPIIYGDYTDDAGYMPMVYDEDIVNFPSYYLETMSINILSDFYCWDKEARAAYKATEIDNNFTLNSDKNQITLNRLPSTAVTYTAINVTDTTIQIIDGMVISIQFDTPVPVEMQPGSKWEVNGDTTNLLEMRELKDGYYLMRATKSPDNDTGTLDLVGGGASVDYSFRSDFLFQGHMVFMEQTEEVRDDCYFSGNQGLSTAIGKATIIQIDDEKMLVYIRRDDTWDATDYLYTEIEVVRGYAGTIPAVHASGIFKIVTEDAVANEWLVKHILPFKKLSNFHWVQDAFDNANAPVLTPLEGFLDDMIYNFNYPAVTATANRMGIQVTLGPLGAGDETATLLLDITLDKINVAGKVENVYLLGSFYVDTIQSAGDFWDSGLLITQGGALIQGVLFNRYNRYGGSLSRTEIEHPNNAPLSFIQSPYGPDYLIVSNVATDFGGIRDFDHSYYCNNPENGFSNLGYNLQKEKDLLIKGKWYDPSIPVTDPFIAAQFTMFGKKVGSLDVQPNNITNIDQLNGTKFSLAWVLKPESASITRGMYIANPAFRVDFFIDPIKFDFWGRGRGRVYDLGTTYYTPAEFNVFRDFNLASSVDLDMAPNGVTKGLDFEQENEFVHFISYDAFTPTDFPGILTYRQIGTGLEIVSQFNDGEVYFDIVAKEKYIFTLHDTGLRVFKYSISTGMEIIKEVTWGAFQSESMRVTQINSDLFYITYNDTKRYLVTWHYIPSINSLTAKAAATIDLGVGEMWDHAVTIKSGGQVYYHVGTDSGGLKTYLYLGGVAAPALQDSTADLGAQVLRVYAITDGTKDRVFTLDVSNAGTIKYNRSTDLYDNTSDIKIAASSPIEIIAEEDEEYVYIFRGSSSSGVIVITDWDLTTLRTIAQPDGVDGSDFGRAMVLHNRDIIMQPEEGIAVYSWDDNPPITNPVSIIEDLARQEIVLLDAEIDQTGFEDAFAARQGWDTTFHLFENQKLFKPILQQIAEEAGLIITETHDGKLTVSVIDPPSDLTGLYEITDDEILRDLDGVSIWSQRYTTLDLLMTELEAKYRLNIPDKSYASNLDGRNVSNNVPEMLDVAETYLNEEKRVTIELDTIRNESTAKLLLNRIMLYHYSPLRIVDVSLHLGSYAVKNGDFVKFGSTEVTDTTNKAYLVIETNLQLPIANTKPKNKLTLLELASESLRVPIQEVPEGAGDDVWDEVPSETGDNVINEVPNMFP